MSRPTIRINRNTFGNPGVTGLVLYRCYGLDGTLMYIGQSRNLQRRIQQHRWSTPWWFAVEHITIQHYKNHKILRQDELSAIWIEEPFFNQHGKGRRQMKGKGPLWNRQRQLSRHEFLHACDFPGQPLR